MVAKDIVQYAGTKKEEKYPQIKRETKMAGLYITFQKNIMLV